MDKALQMVVENPSAKFDESLDVAIMLGVDTRKNEQQVRGSVALPADWEKKCGFWFFAKGPAEEEAQKAGADFVGAEDMVEKIKGGWLDFDCAISTPDMMPLVSKVAKILGPERFDAESEIGHGHPQSGSGGGKRKKGNRRLSGGQKRDHS